MTIGRRFTRSSLVMTLVASTSAPLAAGTVSGTMAVSATVEESCNLDVRPMAFGALPGDHDSVDASASLVLACTPAARYLVTLDTGRHGSDGARRMADATGTRFLAYELYSDAARTRRWSEDGLGGVMPASGRAELDLHGRLAAGYAPEGAYSDTVTVTVTF